MFDNVDDACIAYNKDTMPKYLVEKVKPCDLVMLEVKVNCFWVKSEGSPKAKVRMTEGYKVGFELVCVNLLWSAPEEDVDNDMKRKERHVI